MTVTSVGVASVDVEVNEGVESEEPTTPPRHPQYSPSVSHDEEDRVQREMGELYPERVSGCAAVMAVCVYSGEA